MRPFHDNLPENIISRDLRFRPGWVFQVPMFIYQNKWMDDAEFENKEHTENGEWFLAVEEVFNINMFLSADPEEGQVWVGIKDIPIDEVKKVCIALDDWLYRDDETGEI